MNKRRTARLAGFVGAVGVSAALVAAASSGTGAYFTDSHGGNLTASSGRLTISADSTNINFAGLNPGQDKTQTINYSVNGNSTTNADVWLVFDDGAGYGAFTGAKTTDYGGYTGGGMGQYGHFKLSGSAGTFESYNLQLPADAASGVAPYSSTGTNACNVDANGHGGSAAQHVVGAGNDIAECGVPKAILLTKNLAPGQSASAQLTFGLTGKQTDQNQTKDPNVNFRIVATQPGISPVGATW